MVEIHLFIEEAEKRNLEPRNVFREALKLHNPVDVEEHWEMLWAFSRFKGLVPDYILEYVMSLPLS